MADFARPEYASYVALCREWNLAPPSGNPGHWFEGRSPDGSPRIVCRLYVPPNLQETWLPTLSDWLEMLEEAGVDGLAFGSAPSGWWIAPYRPDNSDGHGYGSTDEPVATGPTREEAAARLWLAVRKPVEATERQ